MQHCRSSSNVSNKSDAGCSASTPTCQPAAGVHLVICVLNQYLLGMPGCRDQRGCKGLLLDALLLLLLHACQLHQGRSPAQDVCDPGAVLARTFES